MGNENFDQFNSANGGQPEQAPAPHDIAPAEVTLKPAPAPTSSEGAQAAGSAVNHNTQMPIGVVLEIAGSGSQIALDLQRLNECMDDEDPSVGLAGQVGSQIKIRVGDIWLLASVRNQRKDHRANGGILANIDFLGEGVEEKLTGRLRGFRRGVTRYPIPGAMVYPANTTDLKQVYASDGRANVEIGTVYPTKDILHRCHAGQALRAAGFDRYR